MLLIFLVTFYKEVLSDKSSLGIAQSAQFTLCLIFLSDFLCKTDGRDTILVLKLSQVFYLSDVRAADSEINIKLGTVTEACFPLCQ